MKKKREKKLLGKVLKKKREEAEKLKLEAEESVMLLMKMNGNR